MATYYDQLEYLAGKHWVNNNYSGYANDDWHVSPRVVLNLGLRYDGLPHAFERYDKFSNFVPELYDRSQGYPLNPDGTMNPAFLSTFPQTGTRAVLPQWHQGSGREWFPARKRSGPLLHLYASRRVRVGRERKRQDGLARRLRIVL